MAKKKRVAKQQQISGSREVDQLGVASVASVASVDDATVDVERAGKASIRTNLDASATGASVPSIPSFSTKEKEEEKEGQRAEAASGVEELGANDATDVTVVRQLPDTEVGRGDPVPSSTMPKAPSVEADAAAERSQATASGAKAKKETQRQLLLAMADDLSLFHDANGSAYAVVDRGTHRETWSLKGSGVRDILSERFYRERRQPPDERALTDVLRMLETRARLDGSERKVFRRVGEHDGNIYLDLCDDGWRSVRITREGWVVCRICPILFIRSNGMLPLPKPERGGSLDELRNFITLDDDTWRIVLAYLAMLLHPRGPYPILVLLGSGGSGKSTMARFLRSLVDPNVGDLNALPRDARDLMIAASNSWVQAFDNVSNLAEWLSDALCRLATGGSLRTRQLYSDGSEAIFNEQRPIILNGIGRFVTREDLLSRALTIDVPEIPKEKRRTEAALWEAFGAAHGRMLGALLDAVSGALRESDGVTLDEQPRMADFAHWGTAVERGLGWPRGSFMSAYNRLLDAGAEEMVESSAVTQALLSILRVSSGAWRGTARQLLVDLNEHVDPDGSDRKEMPRSPRGVAAALQRYAGVLRRVGIRLIGPRAARSGSSSSAGRSKMASPTQTVPPPQRLLPPRPKR